MMMQEDVLFRNWIEKVVQNADKQEREIRTLKRAVIALSVIAMIFIGFAIGEEFVMKKAASSANSQQNITWILASEAAEVTLKIRESTAYPPPSSSTGEFQTEWAPSDPRIPSYTYPACELYCNIIQTQPGPQGIQGNIGPQGPASATMLFGSGSLGSFVFNTTTSLSYTQFSGSAGVFTLLQDAYFHNLTLGPKVQLITCGWRLIIQGTLTLYNGTVIGCDGNKGADETTGTTPGGAATTSGTLGAGQAGAAGVSGNSNGVAGTSASPSIGGSGGMGGSCSTKTSGAGGTATAPTAVNGGVVVYSSSSNGRDLAGNLLLGGAGGGSGATTSASFHSGAGGGGAGNVEIYAYFISIAENTTYVRIGASGGHGGNSAQTTESPGGGGGGGAVKIVTNSYLADFYYNITIDVSGGNAGAGGCGTVGPNPGTSGSFVVIAVDGHVP